MLYFFFFDGFDDRKCAADDKDYIFVPSDQSDISFTTQQWARCVQ